MLFSENKYDDDDHSSDNVHWREETLCIKRGNLLTTPVFDSGPRSANKEYTKNRVWDVCMCMLTYVSSVYCQYPPRLKTTPQCWQYQQLQQWRHLPLIAAYNIQGWASTFLPPSSQPSSLRCQTPAPPCLVGQESANNRNICGSLRPRAAFWPTQPKPNTSYLTSNWYHHLIKSSKHKVMLNSAHWPHGMKTWRHR